MDEGGHKTVRATELFHPAGNLNDARFGAFDRGESQRAPSLTKTIAHAAAWVDDHIPPHDIGELAANGLRGGAKSFYSSGPSLVHGYYWMTDYGGGMRLFGMIADGLAAAINTTECAVALYEAACRRPDGDRGAEQSYVPARLEPTIAAWTGLYE